MKVLGSVLACRVPSRDCVRQVLQSEAAVHSRAAPERMARGQRLLFWIASLLEPARPFRSALQGFVARIGLCAH